MRICIIKRLALLDLQASSSHRFSCRWCSNTSKLRAEFLLLEAHFNAQLERSKLSEAEWEIHCAHAEAIKKRHFTYDDPVTHHKVMTRLCHFLRGKCCGNACRHCVYQHENVAKTHPQRMAFNSSFWVEVGSRAPTEPSVRASVCGWTLLSDMHATSVVDDPLLFKH
ncbi:uncharacterized protein LOC108666082 isoform X2 [Hyalella azteca]|uniref:Uncharacterized protein LOC108666082 isoform X2 n=1 Tax=Hyalella azteca TaxID=294128 RepID=A0A979FTE7_HYAAZ|nr:uncharacterized protein LOC108666082 isoform X2 [Hyalella azteca]